MIQTSLGKAQNSSYVYKQEQENPKMRIMDSNKYRKIQKCELWIQSSSGKAQDMDYGFKQV